MLHITLVKSNISSLELKQLLAYLTAIEQHKFNQLQRPANQQHYLLARILSRTLLTQQLRKQANKLQAQQLVFNYNQYAKPQLADNSELTQPWQFNLSHSGDYVIMALAKQPVGIDIEMLPNHSVTELAQNFFSYSERQQLQQHSDHTEYKLAFLKLWTAKEALLKAHGCGLHTAVALPEFKLQQLNAKQWLTPSAAPFNQYSLRLLDSPANYQIAVSIAQLQAPLITQTNLTTAQLLSLAQQHYQV